MAYMSGTGEVRWFSCIWKRSTAKPHPSREAKYQKFLMITVHKEYTLEQKSSIDYYKVPSQAILFSIEKPTKGRILIRESNVAS